jgi:hypothetical protein
MKAESLSTIRKELQTLDREEILTILNRLVRFSVQNKELTSYLLYYAQFEDLYVSEVNAEMEQLFTTINTRNAFLVKKTIRKIVRDLNKHIRYANSKKVEIELRLHFCLLFKKGHFQSINDIPLKNIYIREVAKIKKAIGTIHEDLQADYLVELEKL